MNDLPHPLNGYSPPPESDAYAATGVPEITIAVETYDGEIVDDDAAPEVDITSISCGYDDTDPDHDLEATRRTRDLLGNVSLLPIR